MNKLILIFSVIVLVAVVFLRPSQIKDQISEDLPAIDQLEEYQTRINEKLEQLKIKYTNIEPITKKHTNFSLSCLLTAEEQKEIQYLEPIVTPLEFFIQLCPARPHLKDNGNYISKDEWDTAVSHLFKNLDYADIYLLGIAAEENQSWWIEHRDLVGKHIRNVLRSEGIDWGNTALENYWYELVEDAAAQLENEILVKRIDQEKIKHGLKPVTARAK